MRYIILINLFFTAFLACGQGFNVVDLPDHSGSSRGASVREVPGGYFVFGEKNDADTLYRVHLSMFGTDGTLLWEQAVVDAGPTVLAYADGVSPTLQEGGWLASVALQHGDSMTWRAHRFGANGDTVWTRNLSSAYQVYPRAAVQQSGAYFFTALTQAFSSATNVASVVKLDTSGNVLRTVAFPNMAFDMLTIAAGVDNDLYLAAGKYPAQTPYRSVVVRLDTAMNVLWSKTILVTLPSLQSYASQVTKVACDAEGNLLVAGNCFGPFSQTEPTPVEFYLAKLSRNDGSLIWVRRYPVSVSENGRLFDMEYLPDGDVVTCGHVTPEVDVEYRGFLHRYSADGNERWRRYYRFMNGPEAFHDLRDVSATADGGFVLTGIAQASTLSPTALWLLRVDEYGCLEPGCQTIGVDEIMIGLSDNALRCSPVPATDQVMVVIDLPQSIKLRGELRLAITDVAGRLVHDTMLGEQHAQRYALNVSAWQSGTYVLHLLDAGLSLLSRKVVVY